MAKRILKLDIQEFKERALAELTAAETGVLMRLLIADAEHDGIPADADALCAIAKVGRAKWDCGLSKKMGMFFTVSGNKVGANLASCTTRQTVEGEKVVSLSTQITEYWKSEFLARHGEYPVNPTAGTIIAVNQAIQRLVRADVKRYTLEALKEIVDYGFERNCPTLAIMFTEYSINRWMQDCNGLTQRRKIVKRERDKFVN
jgi:hypothetical protein